MYLDRFSLEILNIACFISFDDRDGPYFDVFSNFEQLLLNCLNSS